MNDTVRVRIHTRAGARSAFVMPVPIAPPFAPVVAADECEQKRATAARPARIRPSTMNSAVITPIAQQPTERHRTMETKPSSAYNVKESPELGRYLVAARDIKAEEVIIDNEEPIVVGPKQATYPVCLACYRRVDGSYNCSRCQWPLCSEACEQSDSLHSIECDLLANQQARPNSEDLELEDCKIYDCIAPLRLLLEIGANAEKAKLFNSLEHHECHRKKRGIWLADHLSVVQPIRNEWGLGEHVEESELQRACGILEVNAFEVSDEDEGINARAVFGAACLMAHDCVPNTACHVNPTTQRMTVKAAVDIPAGDMITTSYTFTLDGTQRRRDHLRETKFFDCLCKRCTDPSELGTHLSSLVCPKCNGQHVAVPEDPLDADTFWKCTHEECGFEISSVHVNRLLECLQRKADALNYDDIDGLESFIESWTPVLHQNHSILIGVKYYLCHFYGNAPGFCLDDLSPQLLKRKIQLCEEILTVAKILEPGSSRLQQGLTRELLAAEEALGKKTSSSAC